MKFFVPDIVAPFWLSQIQHYCECQEEFGISAANILFENVYLNSWVNIEASVHLSTSKWPKICFIDIDASEDWCEKYEFISLKAMLLVDLWGGAKGNSKSYTCRHVEYIRHVE